MPEYMNFGATESWGRESYDPPRRAPIVHYNAEDNRLAAPIPAGWNNDTLLEYLSMCSFSIEQDNDGQIIIYTGLYLRPDGSLHDDDPSG